MNMKDKKIYLPLLFAFATIIFLFFLRNQNHSYRLHALMKKGMLNEQAFIDSLDFYLENGAVVVNIKEWASTNAAAPKSYRFIIETSGATYFSKKLLAKLAAVEKLIVEDDKGQKKEIPFFLTDAKIQNSIFENIAVGELSNPPPTIDGVIGANLMQHCLWQIDYPKRKIYFSNQLAMLPKQAKVYPISFIRNIFRTPCIYLIINDFPRRPMAQVSTSKPVTILLDKQFSDLRAAMLFPKDSVGTANKLALGDLLIKNAHTAFSSQQQCYLGSEFFKNYILTIDWGNRKMYVSQ